MRTFIFNCAACGDIELQLSPTKDNLLEQTCPDCGGEMHRVYTAPAIQFNGPGFYVNDYKK
jgi:putative FmdB family regulatory protein